MVKHFFKMRWGIVECNAMGGGDKMVFAFTLSKMLQRGICIELRRFCKVGEFQDFKTSGDKDLGKENNRDSCQEAIDSKNPEFSSDKSCQD